MKFSRVSRLGVALCAALLVSGIALAQLNLPRGGIKSEGLPPGAVGETDSLPFGTTKLEGAVNKEAIPMMEGVWALFIQTMAVEDAGLGSASSVLKRMGLDAVNAEVLSQHMKASLDAVKHDALLSREDFCGKREQIATREDLARETTARETASRAQRQHFVDQISQLLDANAQEKFFAEADAVRSSMTLIETDAAAYFSAQPPSIVATTIKRACDPPSSQSFSR